MQQGNEAANRKTKRKVVVQILTGSRGLTVYFSCFFEL